MAIIHFNAFSFLQEKLKAQGRQYSNVSIDVNEGATVESLIAEMGIKPEDVEAVFVNGSVKTISTLLSDGDRVAIIPPGIPGPYRVLLGMIGKQKDRE